MFYREWKDNNYTIMSNYHLRDWNLINNIFMVLVLIVELVLIKRLKNYNHLVILR